MFSKSKKNERLKGSGVIWESSIEVPEMPLSYSFNGARNTVTPVAFMMPAAVKNSRFLNFGFFISDLFFLLEF